MFLEHLASDNGADMHKYNTLYTHKLNWHVLTPESVLQLPILYVIYLPYPTYHI